MGMGGFALNYRAGSDYSRALHQNEEVQKDRNVELEG